MEVIARLKGKVLTVDLVKTLAERYQMLLEIRAYNKFFEQHRAVLEEHNWQRLSHSQVCEVLEKMPLEQLQAQQQKQA